MALAIMAGKRKATLFVEPLHLARKGFSLQSTSSKAGEDLFEVVPRHLGAKANFLQGQSRLSQSQKSYQGGISLSQIGMSKRDSQPQARS